MPMSSPFSRVTSYDFTKMFSFGTDVVDDVGDDVVDVDKLRIFSAKALILR